MVEGGRGRGEQLAGSFLFGLLLLLPLSQLSSFLVLEPVLHVSLFRAFPCPGKEHPLLHSNSSALHGMSPLSPTAGDVLVPATNRTCRMVQLFSAMCSNFKSPCGCPGTEP